MAKQIKIKGVYLILQAPQMVYLVLICFGPGIGNSVPGHGQKRRTG